MAGGLGVGLASLPLQQPSAPAEAASQPPKPDPPQAPTAAGSCSTKGAAAARDPAINRGCATTPAARQQYALQGLLPPRQVCWLQGRACRHDEGLVGMDTERCKHCMAHAHELSTCISLHDMHHWCCCICRGMMRGVVSCYCVSFYKRLQHRVACCMGIRGLHARMPAPTCVTC